MKRIAFRIVYPAVLASLSTIVLLVGSILPSGQIGFAALASFFPLVAVLDLGWGAGTGTFAVSAILSMFLTGDRTASILYCSFPGWYPIARFFLMRLPSGILRWVLRLAVFNAAACTVLFLLSGMLELTLPNGSSLLALVFGNMVFLVYEFLITKFSIWYILKISPKIKRG